MITTIIFDIGNVLAAYDWEGALRMKRLKPWRMLCSEALTGKKWTVES